MTDNREMPDLTMWQERFQAVVDELPGPLPERIAAVAAKTMQEEMGGRSDGWEVYTLANAYASRPPMEYVVSGLFSLPSLSIVYGAPGTFKSLLLADLAVCVAAGLPWLQAPPTQDGPMSRATMRAPVLWCDFDNGQQRTHERFEALGRAYDVREDVPLKYVSMPNPWLDASKSTDIDSLTQRIENMGIKLVVVDNLGVVSGDADENSAQMADVLASFRRVAESTGAAVILIHHQRKAKDTSVRAGDTLRGHSSIEAALDLALLVQRDEHSSIVNVRSTKARGIDVPSFAARFAYEHKPDTAELRKARFFGVPVGSEPPDTVLEQAIVEEVRDHSPRSKEALKDAVKAKLPDVGINRIASVIDALVHEGVLEMTTGRGRTQLFGLAGGNAVSDQS
jgi:hypothetical protein